MKTFQHLLFVVLLCVVFCCASLQSTPIASQQAVGSADCFNQKLSSILNQLIQYCNYVCTINTVYGQALPGAYNPFGSQWAFPVMNSVEASFYEIFYGRPDEGFCAVSRNATSGTGFIGYNMSPNTTYKLAYPLDDAGQLELSEAPQNVSYSPTSRIWYTGALSAADGLYVTSTPYVVTTTNTLGIGAAQQCVRGGKLELVSSTLALVNLITDDYFTQSACSQFDSADGAVAYVVNSQGILVLESDAILSSIINATHSSSGAVRAAATYALQHGFGVSAVGQGTFTYNGQTWEVYSRPVSSASWNWAVVVARPATSTCSAASSFRSPLSSLISTYANSGLFQ